MSHRITLSSFFLVVALVLAGEGAAFAQSPNPQAEALNNDGKALYKSQDWNGAAAKFRQAIQLSPDARYYFNLCATLEKAGDYDGALEACDNVYGQNPKDDLKAKTGQRAAEIRQKKRARDAANPPPDGGGSGGGGTTGDGGTAGGTTGDGGGTTGDGGGTTGDGGTGGGTTGDGGTGGGDVGNPYGGGGGGGGDVYRTPPPGGGDASVEAQADPRDKYKWSLGIDLGIAFNQGVGRDSYFGDSGQAIRFHADFLFAPKRKIGGQVYVNISAFDTEDITDEYQLTIADIGAAVYWHRRLAKGLYITPLAGVQITSLQPQRNVDEAYGTIGVRGDLALNWVLGGGRHVFTFVPVSLNLYAGSQATVGDTSSDFYGFDSAGATYAVTVGYTFRFTSDILPGLIVLE